MASKGGIYAVAATGDRTSRVQLAARGREPRWGHDGREIFFRDQGAMFAIGGLPALFIAYVRLYVQEPERWRNRVAAIGRWRARDAFFALFSLEYRRRTLLNCVFLLISMIGLWAGSVYAPAAVTQVATRMGYGAADAARVSSRATMLLAIGTMIGCLIMPTLAQRFGRRGAVAFFYALMAISIAPDAPSAWP